MSGIPSHRKGAGFALKQHDHGKDMERYSTDTMGRGVSGAAKKPAGYSGRFL